MKKLLMLSSLLLLSACSSDEENVNQVEESSVVEESTESERDIGDLIEKNYPMTQVELEGSYHYYSNDKETEGTFEKDGALRIKDGSGNLRYYVNEEFGRVVIDSNIYLVNKMENGYELTGIDKNSQKTNQNITLINLN